MAVRVEFEPRNAPTFAGFHDRGYRPPSSVYSLYLTGQARHIEGTGKYKSFIGKICPYAINYSEGGFFKRFVTNKI